MKEKNDGPTSIPDMHWIILSGNEQDFNNAPEWAKRLVCIQGQTYWWDGSSTWRDTRLKSGYESHDFGLPDVGYIVAERRWVRAF